VALVIHPDGSTTELLPESGTKLSLEELQAAVGGLIEHVAFETGPVFVNEEGLRLRLPLNPRASELLRRPIVGAAVFCDASEID
jgi:hypothetical protein